MSELYSQKVAEWAALVGASLPTPRRDDPDFETASGAE